MLQLTSSNSDVTVKFSDIDGDYFRVSVLASDHSAARRVFAYTDAAGIARMFSEAAREWKGWSGAKVWESIEGELRFELRIDRLGHVTLGIRIRSDPDRADPWRLDAELGLDAGQLDGVARAADRLWCTCG